MKLPKFIRNFLPYRMKRQIKELFVANIIISFALSMVQVFEPIYLYKSGYSLIHLVAFYLVVYSVYFFLIPLGAKFANKYGYENGMFLGSSLYVVFYISLFLISVYSSLFYVAAVLYALQKAFYWPAFHADFAHNSDDAEEAREISSVYVSNSLMFILGPVIGGFIITQFGFSALFIFASILFLLSNIPMLLTKEKFTKREFAYSSIFKNLFHKRNLRSLLACVGYGEELIVMVVWPVYMSLIIVNYDTLGALIGLATMITLLSALYVGKMCDNRDKRKILRFGAIVYSLSWLIKIFTRTIMPLFLIDTTGKVSKSVIDVPIRAIFYEKAKEAKKNNDNGIMENVVNYEAGLVVGKIVACLFIFLVISIFSTSEATGFTLSFIFASLISLLYIVL